MPYALCSHPCALRRIPSTLNLLPYTRPFPATGTESALLSNLINSINLINQSTFSDFRLPTSNDFARAKSFLRYPQHFFHRRGAIEYLLEAVLAQGYHFLFDGLIFDAVGIKRFENQAF